MSYHDQNDGTSEKYHDQNDRTSEDIMTRMLGQVEFS